MLAMIKLNDATSQAICLAKESPNANRYVIRKIAGFVFMGCPHSLSRDLEDWTGLDSILQIFTKGRKKPLESRCIERLSVDCEKFRNTLAEERKLVLTGSRMKGVSTQSIGKKVFLRFRRQGHALNEIYHRQFADRHLCNHYSRPGDCDRRQLKSP